MTRKFILKLYVFIVIPIIFNALFVLLTPHNLLTFRSWEALHVFSPPLLDGPFYPNQRIEMIEVGDLGKGTPYAILKPVIFITDHYGYRNTPQFDKDYEVVIVGDSMTVGSGLTQTDTLSEALSRHSTQTTYNYAPAEIADFLTDARFQTSPPDTVILQVVERNLLTDFCPQTLNTTNSVSAPNSLAVNLRVFLDTILRNPFYLQAYFKGKFMSDDRHPIVNDEGMIFFDQSLSHPEQSSMTVEQVVDSVKRCEAWLADRGIDLIFLPVPDKENVFFDMIPIDERPPMSVSERRTFFKSIVTVARTNDIDTADLLTAYLQARKDGVMTYQLDDTHWNATGIAIAVERVLPMVENQ